jgi:hypothetical protein
MLVRVVRPFVTRLGGAIYRPSLGALIELPEGADWLTAGLVVVEALDAERAVTGAPETPEGALPLVERRGRSKR